MRSADGRYVYFESSATNLTTDHLSRQPSVYVRDRTAGTTTRIDLPGDDGAANRLLAVSTNGRFALMLSTGATAFWRYDRQTGTATPVAGAFRWAPAYSISDDGDLVSLGEAVERLRDGTFLNLTCPNGSNTFYGPDYVRFAGDGSAVYFTTDECGQFLVDRVPV